MKQGIEQRYDLFLLTLQQRRFSVQFEYFLNINYLFIYVMAVADCRADETGQYRCFREWIDRVAVSGSWLILLSEIGWFNGSLFAPLS